MITGWREAAVLHEGSHLAAARCAGFTDARAELLSPVWDEGRIGRTYLEGDGDRSPLTRAIISYCPALTIVGADWEGPGLVSDRADVEAVRPAHWPAYVWEFHIAEKTRELIQTERFRIAYHEACKEIEDQTGSSGQL
jgi:hypothetical protein